ncbi:MAG: DUF364 domain-containing protein [Syntrophorhabdales bacterium]|jgi:uncharacterized protein (DUF4213/DUF364 family)
MIVEKTADLLRVLYGEKIRDIRIERIVIGVFFTGVKLSDGSGGVAYTPTADLHGVGCCPSMAAERPAPVPLKGMAASEVLEQSGGPMLSDLVKLVVMNALSSRFITPDRYRIIYDADALELIDLRNAGRIAMVGAFIPFLKQFKMMPGIDLSVIERRPETLKADEMRFYVPAEKAREVLPLADTVIITGASIANRTIDELLGMTRPGATVIVTGPTASILPDVLFENNVHALSGVYVTDPDMALDMLAEGQGAYHLFDTCVRKMNIVRA